MADPRGFLKYPEREGPSRPVPVRIMDFNEVYERQDKSTTQTQASRCMDCGIPFCHTGCPWATSSLTGMTSCGGTSGRRPRRGFT